MVGEYLLLKCEKVELQWKRDQAKKKLGFKKRKILEKATERK